MVRIVKDADVRRREILQAARALFYTAGYEQTAVRDIIDVVGIAKGTFYHHFPSKEAVLDTMVQQMLQQSVAILTPMVQDASLTALEKLERLFADSGTLKLENEALVKTLLPVWYKDENAIMREKIKAASVTKLTPLLTQIIYQGIAEGSFRTDYPQEMAIIVLQLSQNLSETMVALLVEAEGETAVWPQIKRRMTVYQEAITRLLGAEPGAITIADIDRFRPLFTE